MNSWIRDLHRRWYEEVDVISKILKAVTEIM